MSATHTLPTVTREALPNGKHRYRVNGEVHTKASTRLYTHASVYRVVEATLYHEAGAEVVFLHSRADLAARGNSDGNRIASWGAWTRVPGVVEVEGARS